MMMNQLETKHWTVEATISPPLANGAISHVTGISQGDTNSTREGAVVTLSKISVNYGWTKGDANNIVRFLIVRYNDYQNPGAADFWESPGATFKSHQEVDKMKLFTVLYDSGPTSIETDTNIISGNVTIYPKTKVYFNGASATGPKGGIYLLVGSDSLAAAHSEFDFNCQVSFKDT